MGSLGEMPSRHPPIPEAKALGRPLRAFHHHSHRVVYEVQETHEIVYVVRVYHGARRPLTRRDVP